MKLLKLALLLVFAAAAYGLRGYANARRNATAADSPAQTAPQAPANSEMTTMLETLAGVNGKLLDLAMRVRSGFASSVEGDRFPQVTSRNLRHDARRMARRGRLRTAHSVDDRRHRRVQIQIPF